MMKIRSYEFNWMCCDAHFLNFCSTGAHAGTISFNEYCFRFGRRYQIEHNRRRRNGISVALIAVWVPRWFPGVYRYSVMYLHYSGHIELILQGSTSNKQTSVESERLQKDTFVCETLLLLSKL